MTHDSILFKSVTLALPGEEKIGDLLVQNGKIAAIGPNLGAHASLIINEPHLTLMPGVLDPHVHFREPGATHKEDLYSGSKAAAAGGVTSFLDMPNNTPSATTRETIALKKELAAAASLINYGFFIGATTENLTELQKAEQVPGIKVFMGSSTGTLLVDQRKELEQIFATTPHLIAVHAEDEAIINHNKEKYQGHTDPITHTKIRTPEAALKSTQHTTPHLPPQHRRRSPFSKKRKNRHPHHHRSLSPTPATLRRSPLQKTRHLCPNQPSPTGRRPSCPSPLESPQKWHHRYDRNRPRPTYLGRKISTLPQSPFRHARCRNLPPPHAHPTQSRPLHPTRNPQMDV